MEKKKPISRYISLTLFCGDLARSISNIRFGIARHKGPVLLSKRTRAKTFDPRLCATADRPQYCVLLRYSYILSSASSIPRQSGSYCADDWHSTSWYILPTRSRRRSSTTLRRVVTPFNSWLVWLDLSWALVWSRAYYLRIFMHIMPAWLLSPVTRSFEFLRQPVYSDFCS